MADLEALFEDYRGTEVEWLGVKLFADLYTALDGNLKPTDEVQALLTPSSSRLPLIERVIIQCVELALQLVPFTPDAYAHRKHKRHVVAHWSRAEHERERLRKTDVLKKFRGLEKVCRSFGSLVARNARSRAC